MKDRMVEQVRFAARAMMYAANRGAFDADGSFPLEGALRSVVDLMALADEIEGHELSSIGAPAWRDIADDASAGERRRGRFHTATNRVTPRLLRAIGAL